MSETILICESDKNFALKISKTLKEANYTVATSGTGKEAQSNISKMKFGIIFIDIDLNDVSSFDLLTYIRVNAPSSRVIFSYSDDDELEDLGLDAKMATKLGICTLIRKPFKDKRLLEIIEDNPSERKWQESIGVTAPKAEDATDLSDSKFTNIKIQELYLGATTLFDFYIKISNNKYLKLLHKGEVFSKKRLQEYEISKNVEYLYFLTKDRGEYIEFMNDFLEKYLKRKRVHGKQALLAARGLVDHFVEEVHMKGFTPKLAEQGKLICDNLFKVVNSDSSMGALLEALFEEAPERISYTFLTAFFSSITLAGIDWSGETSSKYAVQGALLHEIGKLKLPDEIKMVPYDDLTPAQKLIYQTYPTEGFNLLSGSSVPQQVKQIIYQHKEFINGNGYPNGLTGLRIFPLAKIVSFSSGFAEFVIKKNLSPIRAMKVFITMREELNKYDSECIKSFIGGMAKSK